MSRKSKKIFQKYSDIFELFLLLYKKKYFSEDLENDISRRIMVTANLNQTPISERMHIAFFGMRNAGKSSLINAVTGQELAIISPVPGTTTDPVHKTMELLPLGPVVLIDTPGIDDSGELGAQRINKTHQVLNKTDAAILVVDVNCELSKEDEELIELFREKKIPYIIALNKSDLKIGQERSTSAEYIFVSALTGQGIHELKERIAGLCKSDEPQHRLVTDLIDPSDFVVLVTPIDKAAPKGRLILPQQQVIRDILEANAVSIVTKENEFKNVLKNLAKKPRMIITDSQIFDKVAADTPHDIPLTSFSILMARYKGLLDDAVRSVKAIEHIEDGDKILIAEGCTHHRQCDDIGSVKLPRWIKNHTGKHPEFCFCSGAGFPSDLADYKLIVHCGGCMLNTREMQSRAQTAKRAGVPITNYGILIACMQGILKRSIGIFPHL